MPITQTEIVNFDVTNGKARLSDSEIFNKMIKKHLASDLVAEATAGDAYFTVDNVAIAKKDFTEHRDGKGTLHNSKTDERLKNKPNNKVAAGFARKHVLEKVAYLAKNPIVVKHKTEEYVDKFKEVLGRKFHAVFNTALEEASNRGNAWVHFFLIKDSHKLGYMAMHTAWIIPIRDKETDEKLERLIRFYPIEENIAGNSKVRYHLEDWGPEIVTHWEQKEGDEFHKLETKGHFDLIQQTKAGTQKKKVGDSGWGVVPFVEIKNNNSVLPDLHFIREAVDAYDMQVSLFSNDIEAVRQMLLKFIGTNQDIEELMSNILIHGGVAIEPGSA